LSESLWRLGEKLLGGNIPTHHLKSNFVVDEITGFPYIPS
jgi:hypothetical protein